MPPEQGHIYFKPVQAGRQWLIATRSLNTGHFSTGLGVEVNLIHHCSQTLLGTDFPVPPGMGNRIAKFHRRAENELMFKEGQRVRANLAGMQAGGVLFHAAVTDAVGNVVRQTSENPPVYLVRLLFSFKGVNEVEVPAERITAF